MTISDMLSILRPAARVGYIVKDGYKSPFNQDNDKNSEGPGWRARLREWMRRITGRKKK